jgi:hypothetical protein
MAGMTLGNCGKCHRSIPMPSPVGSYKGGDGRSHMAHKGCADDIHAEANPVVITSREELLKGIAPIDLPLPPVLQPHITEESLEDAPSFEDKVSQANLDRLRAMEPQPSTPVREQQAARRKPPGRPKKAVAE